jgi:hypothetical protein
MAVIHGRFKVVMYRTRKDWLARRSYKTVESDNVVLDGGAELVAYLFSGASIAAPGSTTGFDATAQIGVSDKEATADPSDTDFDLDGGESEAFATVEDIPTWDADARTLAYVAVFTAGVGSFVWLKIALLNVDDVFFDISAPADVMTEAKGAAEVWEAYCYVCF